MIMEILIIYFVVFLFVTIGGSYSDIRKNIPLTVGSLIAYIFMGIIPLVNLYVAACLINESLPGMWDRVQRVLDIEIYRKK